MKRIVKDPKERRRELIDAAERLFINAGYEQTAISDIVKDLNISQGAFYYYFDGKEDVLVAVLEKQISIMECDFVQIANRTDLDPAVQLNSMINRFISLNASGRRIMAYIHQEKNATLHRKIMSTRPLERIAPMMADVICKGRDLGRFHVAHPLGTSYLLLMLVASALHFIYQPWLRDPEDAGNADGEFQVHMRMALEDLLGRMLGVSDYRFILQI
jgi:AcrR family transcriptional regulator